MNKLALLALFSISIVGVAGAQTKKPAKAPTKIKCAVMSNEELDIATATKNKMFADYKGRRYYFCCAGCPAAFKANPAKYAKSPSLPTPKK
jgi:YHS domain-containing protein